MFTLRTLAFALVAVGIAACAHTYYQVTDPASGKVFYTEEIKRNGPAIEFKDQSGSVVTLQNSEIKQIDKKEYETGVAPPPKK